MLQEQPNLGLHPFAWPLQRFRIVYEHVRVVLPEILFVALNMLRPPQLLICCFTSTAALLLSCDSCVRCCNGGWLLDCTGSGANWDCVSASFSRYVSLQVVAVIFYLTRVFTYILLNVASTILEEIFFYS